MDNYQKIHQEVYNDLHEPYIVIYLDRVKGESRIHSEHNDESSARYIAGLNNDRLLRMHQPPRYRVYKRLGLYVGGDD